MARLTSKPKGKQASYFVSNNVSSCQIVSNKSTTKMAPPNTTDDNTLLITKTNLNTT